LELHQVLNQLFKLAEIRTFRLELTKLLKQRMIL
jgi:hypothetical protein